jgi:uncharacterized membrane protein
MYGYSYGSGMMGGYSPFMGLAVLMFWLVILAAVVILIVWIVRETSGHRWAGHTHEAPPAGTPGAQHAPQRDEAMEIARRRLAAGEITTEQFEEIRKAIGG